jgi:acyl-[acyl-carrier-protein]-phospholipid O-acyltransferase/long-chain-fatty-acid--[acyl-carrier-protein] ligase
LAGMTVWVPVSLRMFWVFFALTGTGVCGGLFLIPTASFLQVHPEATDKGRVLATVNFSCFIGIMLAGTVFSFLDAHLTPAQGMFCLACFSLVAAGILHLLIKTDFNPVPKTVQWIFRCLLALRYRIVIQGLDAVEKDGNPIMFLPNHSALIDPVIVMTLLYSRFQPRPFADADQAAKAGTRFIMQFIRPITVPDIRMAGRGSRDRVKEALDQVVAGLAAGDNILLYPAGRLCRSVKEDLAGNSGVERILAKVQNVRTVLVRTTGLWGSGFSWATGQAPSLWQNVKRLPCFLVANFLCFGPRRRVRVELVEVDDLRATANRKELNGRLETFYNARSEVNTFVPYFWWQGRKAKVMPEPEQKRLRAIGSAFRRRPLGW